MKVVYKLFLVLFMLASFSSSSIGQTVVSDEDFDALSNGDKIAQNLTTYWDTWSGNPGSSEDGVASNTYAYSSPNSMKIVDGNDVLLYMKSDKTRFSSGYYLYSHYMYVPSANAGYFNLQALKASIWALEVYINNAGSSYIKYGNSPTLNIDSYVTLDSWMLFKVKVDLDNDLATLWIDDSEVVSWTWSDCGSSELHAVDYWGANNNYIAYFDDIDFEHVYAGGDATICDNATSYTLSEASQSGYDEVEWTSSGTGSFTNSAVVNAVYNPSAADKTNGQVTLTISATKTATSTTHTDEMTLSFYDPFTAGAIQTTGETICYDGDPGEIGSTTAASGGDENITYKWQSSTDESFTSPVDISGSNSVTYDPPSGLTETTWYRRMAKDGTCYTTFTASTGAWKVTVYEEFSVGSISEDQSICYNTTPEELQGTAPTGGNTPYTYQWRKSTNGISFSDIDGATSLNYQPPALSQTTYYQLVQTSASGCGQETTNTVTIYVHNLCCSDWTTNCQQPDPSSTGYTSDIMGGTKVYDNFSGIVGGVTRIEWWGGTVDGSADPCIENPKDFVITFYYDDNGSPGSQYQYATYTANVTGTYTGADWGPNDVPIMHYEYTLDKAFSGLSEGWVSIQGYPAGSCEFQWLTSPNGDGKAFVDGRSEVDEDFSYGLHSDPSIPLSPWALFSGIALIAVFLGWRVIRLYR